MVTDQTRQLSPHPTTRELSDFQNGQLSDREIDSVAAHLELCFECSAMLDRLETEDDPFTDPLRHLGSTVARQVADIDAKKKHRAPAPEATEKFGRYEVIEMLGRGGMAVVYKARQPELNRFVALKVLAVGAAASADDLARFHAEAEVLAQLEHPNLVQVLEAGEFNGQPYLTLEYLSGGSLDKSVRGNPMPARAAAELVYPLAQAVEIAHRAGVTHRDIKPSNVLRTADGRPKLTDFGLAKWSGREGEVTRTGIVAGTPSYMAPEQAAGQSRLIGPSVDVYGLGALLYECLTGRPPFMGENAIDIIGQVNNLDPITPSRLVPGTPLDLDTICLKCLRKEPSGRYATAGDLAADLERWLTGKPIQARPVGLLGRATRWTKRNPRLAALSAAVVLSLVLGVAFSTFFGFKARARADDAEHALKDVKTAQKETDRLAAELLLDAGQREAEAGNVAGGLYKFVEALRRAPADAAPLRAVIRKNFAGWSDYLPTLVRYEPLTEHINDCRFVGSVGDRFWLRTGDENQIRSAANDDLLSDAKCPTLPLAAISRDGTRGIVVKDHKATIIDLRTNQPVGPEFEFRHNLKASPGARQWAFGPGNETVAVHLPDWNKPPSVVRVWDVKTGKPLLAPIETDLGASYYLTSARDGRTILILFRQDATRAVAWDVKEGKELTSIPDLRDDDPVLGPDGRLLLAVIGSDNVYQWDRKTGEKGKRLFSVAPNSRIGVEWCGASMLGDGLRIAACDDSRRIRWYDVVSGIPAGGYSRAAETPGVVSGELVFAVGPDGTAVSCTRDRGDLQIWKLGCSSVPSYDFGERRKEPKDPLTIISSNGQFAFFGDHQGEGSLRDALTGEPIGRPLRGPRKKPTFSRDTRMLAAVVNAPLANRELSVGVWDTNTGKPLFSPLFYAPLPQYVEALSFSPDGKSLAVGYVAGVVFWDLPSGKFRKGINLVGPIRGFAFSADSKSVAIAVRGGWDHNQPGLTIRDCDSGREIGEFVHTQDEPTLFSDSDGVTVWSYVPEGGWLRGWNMHTGDEVGKEHQLHPTQKSNASALRTDGSAIAIALPGGEVMQWDTHSGKRLGPAIPVPIEGAVNFVTYSPSGGLLAVAYPGNVARIFDAETARQVGPALFHRAPLGAISFTADGRGLATVETDGNTQTHLMPSDVPDKPDLLSDWL